MMKTATTLAAMAFAASGTVPARAQMGAPAKEAPAAEEKKAAPQQQRAPRETVTATLNGKKVTVDYGRPALAGRTLDQLMAKLGTDRVWRAGENQVTTLTTETGLMIGGKRVPAGKYSLYLHLPEGGDWHLLLNSNPGIPLKEIYAAAPPDVANELWPRLDGYDKVAATEVLRVPLKRTTAAEPMDRFLIGLAPAKGGASSISFTWGDQTWTTDITSAR
jgi:Protein of unknown function (DUF2911)